MVPRGRFTFSYAILSADSGHTGFRHGSYSLTAARENYDRQGAADYHCCNGKGERGRQYMTA
jgi:hypothetical protein